MTHQADRFLQSEFPNLRLDPATQWPVAEMDEAERRILLEHSSRGLDKYLEALLRTEPACRANDKPPRSREELVEPMPVARICCAEAGRAEGAVNDDHALGRNAGQADRDRLSFRDANDAIHPAQVESVEGLVEPHLETLPGPAARHRHNRNPATPRRDTAKQVGLVSMAAQHLDAEVLQAGGQLARCRS